MCGVGGRGELHVVVGGKGSGCAGRGREKEGGREGGLGQGQRQGRGSNLCPGVVAMEDSQLWPPARLPAIWTLHPVSGGCTECLE